MKWMKWFETISFTFCFFFYIKIGSFLSQYETKTKDEEEEEEVIKKKKPCQKHNTSLGKKRSNGHIPAEDEESSATEISSKTEEPAISSYLFE
jgi:hypothetical protein